MVQFGSELGMCGPGYPTCNSVSSLSNPRSEGNFENHTRNSTRLFLNPAQLQTDKTITSIPSRILVRISYPGIPQTGIVFFSPSHRQSSLEKEFKLFLIVRFNFKNPFYLQAPISPEKEYTSESECELGARTIVSEILARQQQQMPEVKIEPVGYLKIYGKKFLYGKNCPQKNVRKNFLSANVGKYPQEIPKNFRKNLPTKKISAIIFTKYPFIF